jgi:hypothetical protein
MFKNDKLFTGSLICIVFEKSIYERLDINKYDLLVGRYNHWGCRTTFTMNDRIDAVCSYVGMRNAQAYKSLIIEKIIKR